jgi:hypothetical protein
MLSDRDILALKKAVSVQMIAFLFGILAQTIAIVDRPCRAP